MLSPSHSPNSGLYKSVLNFLELVKLRRSVRDLTNDGNVPKSLIISIVKDFLKHVPSSHNSQTTRALVLFGRHHEKLWDEVVLEYVQNNKKEDEILRYKKKAEMFKRGMGTICFYTDNATVKALQQKRPLMAEKISLYARDSNSMFQYGVWTALAGAEIGASLQSYEDLLLQKSISKEYNVSEDWKLAAIMPFGKINNPPSEKTFIPLEPRIKVLDGDE